MEWRRAEVARALLRRGAKVNPRRPDDGMTALHLASTADGAKLLIEGGADTEALDGIGRSPLHFAAQFGHPDVAGSLIRSGSETDRQTPDGMTQLHWAAHLSNDVARRRTSDDVLGRLPDLFVRRGVPDHVRSDGGPGFTAKALRGWLGRVGVMTLFIAPESPWENGDIESFDGRLSDERLVCEVFDTLLEAKVLIEW